MLAKPQRASLRILNNLLFLFRFSLEPSIFLRLQLMNLGNCYDSVNVFPLKRDELKWLEIDSGRQYPLSNLSFRKIISINTPEYTTDGIGFVD